MASGSGGRHAASAGAEVDGAWADGAWADGAWADVGGTAEVAVGAGPPLVGDDDTGSAADVVEGEASTAEDTAVLSSPAVHAASKAPTANASTTRRTPQVLPIAPGSWERDASQSDTVLENGPPSMGRDLLRRRWNDVLVIRSARPHHIMVTAAIALAVAACSTEESTQTAQTSVAPTSAGVVTTIPRPTTTAVSTTSSTVAETAPSTAPSSTSPPATTPAPTTTVPPAAPPPNDNFAAVQIGFEQVADVNSPTAIAWRDGDPSMYVTTQEGFISRTTPDGLVPVGDLSGETIELLSGSERGLLGAAFDPRDGRLYVNFTDLDNNTRVWSYEMAEASIVPDSRREILMIEQPGVGHNGGGLLFDADGNLFIGSGDGGGSNGRDAADTSKLLGVIMRITPNLDGDGYTIPTDNPFADGVADRPEVWARGFRNPWSFSIDWPTGDMWIGDVGNDEREEVSVMRGGERGLNFGWPWFEGTNPRRSGAPEGVIPPVFDYPRSDGVAVMGGHVYRGAAFPELEGAYLFADLGGAMWAIGADGVSRLDVDPPTGIVGWGEDPDGELYLLSLYDGVFKLVPENS
ncbi:MAG: PQQ-dependent sugar dehydrogenase [Actinomycetota bacterium]